MLAASISELRPFVGAAVGPAFVLQEQGHTRASAIMRTRRCVRVLTEEQSSLTPRLVQGRTQVAEGSKLKLHQENQEGGEKSKALAGGGSPPSTAMRCELQGGSRDSGASPFQMDYSEIAPSQTPEGPAQGPDRAASGISKAAEVAVPAIDSVKSKQPQSPGDSVDGRNLLRTRREGKISVELKANHDPDGFSKNLDPVGPAPGPAGSHGSHEDEHGSQSQMPGAKNNRGRSASIPWMGLPCSRCRSTNFTMYRYTDANAESGVNQMQYECNNCKQLLCTGEERSYKHLGSELKVEDRAKKGASRRQRRRGIGLHGIIQAMSNPEPGTLAASNSSMKAMPPPSDPSRIAMPPPSSIHKPYVPLPDIQDTAFHSAKTLPSRSSSCSDKLEEDHRSREPNLQQVVAPEPVKILEAKGPFHYSADLKEPPSNQSAKGNQKEPSLANVGFSVTYLRDSIRDHRSSPLEENKKGSGGGTVSDGERPSNGLPCSSCKSTNTRFCLSGPLFCYNCENEWTLGHLPQHEIQLPSTQSAKGKEKEKEKETPSENADQFLGKGLGDSSGGPRSLNLHGSEDGNGGSNDGPLIPFSCSRCQSTFTRLCTYGVFCDACGKHSPYARTLDHEANPPVAMVHEVFDADGRSRGYQLQSLPPPRRPMVDASTQTDPVATVPVDSHSGKITLHGLTHTHQQVGERKRRKRRRRFS